MRKKEVGMMILLLCGKKVYGIEKVDWYKVVMEIPMDAIVAAR